MRLAITADLHGHLPAIPDCDLLLIGGDIVPLNSHHPMVAKRWLASKFSCWLLGLLARRIAVVAVAGNHDIIFERAPEIVPHLDWRYLQDSDVDVDGLKIWGSPHTPRFFDWAFNRTEEQLAAAWQLIPPDTDILLLHGPPRGCGDWSTYGNEHCGSPSLRARIEEIQPRYVFCGHIHGGYGSYRIGETVVVNAAHCDEQYRPVNPVVVLEV